MKTKILLLTSFILFLLTSCEDVVDRPVLAKANDDNYWTSESKVRLYANQYYPRFFTGYNTGNSTAFTAYLGYLFSDDILYNGTQEQFEVSPPNSRGYNGTSTNEWLAKYSGPTWSFTWIRKSNIMIDRIQNRMGGILNEETKNHWLGIARFFRAIDYAGLVSVFGDVPYYDHEVSDADLNDLYKPRTPRNEVMDAVYNDFVFAMNNVRLNDGNQYLNRYAVAGLVSRWALFEGTWQKYHYNNSDRAQKFLKLAIEAANFIRLSSKYSFDTDFRSLFGSNDLSGSKECILYRSYDLTQNASHTIATSCNLVDGRYYSPNLSLIKTFICNDGSDWQTSSNDNNKNFSLDNLIKTRDPRFEASFWRKPYSKAYGSFLYVTKFISRNGLKYVDEGSTTPMQEYVSTNNSNDYPVVRYGEVLLNLIEAKAELATMGGDAVTQSDIEMTINKIRQRPLAEEAIAAGVKQTAPMLLSNLPNSPNRGDIPQLIWEIRRERRMELAFEHSRLLDVKRWKKLEYMDDSKNADILKGLWINFPKEFPDQLSATNVGKLAVTDMNGKVTVYNGSNANQMVGFYSPTTTKGRNQFLNVFGVNPYLAPVGINERVAYQTKGYELAQTEGWPSDL